MDIRVFDTTGKRLGNFNVRLSDMKGLEVAKTANSGKAVVKWLNTEDGQEWLNKRIESPTYTAIGAFL